MLETILRIICGLQVLTLVISFICFRYIATKVWERLFISMFLATFIVGVMDLLLKAIGWI